MQAMSCTAGAKRLTTGVSNGSYLLCGLPFDQEQSLEL